MATFNPMTNFRAMTVKELRESCKQMGIKGYGHWSKEELVNALDDTLIEQMKAETPAAVEEPAKETTVTPTATSTVTPTIKVVLLAFTGMKIAEFEAELKDKEYIVLAKNGKELHFDTNGKQLNAKNPKFGNTIRIIA